MLQWFPSNPYPISDDNVQNLYPFSDQNGSKTIPFGAAHTYIADIGQYPLDFNLGKFKNLGRKRLLLQVPSHAEIQS